VRSIAFLIAIVCMAPLAVVFPFVGLLLWAWTSFSSLNRETFGIAYDFPFNYYIAITTIGAWLLSSEPKSLPNQLMPVLAILFAVWVSITTYFALDFDSAYWLWENHIKTMVLVLMVLALVNDKLRLQAFVWIIVLSIGYYAAKGAGFMLLTGSVGRVFGPERSMITDNNNLSLAIVMIIPLLHYLRMTSRNQAVRYACVALIAASIVAVIGTYSRGGFVGLVAVGAAFLVISRGKLAVLGAGGLVVVAVLNFAPDAWFDRIGTIVSYKQDSSSVGRLNAWQTTWNMVQQRPVLGGGYSAIEQPRVYKRFRPAGDETESRAAHSIYFQILGDHGFVGLLLYLAMLIAATYNLFLVQRFASGRDDLEWAGLLSRMLLVCLFGFVSAGTFLSMAYYDVLLCTLGLTAALRVRDAVREVARQASETEPAPLIEDAEGTPLVPAWRTASGRDAR
jgi:probable O-glycosylation ligase (exosortase A-associated)